MARDLADLARSAANMPAELQKAQRSGVFKAAMHTKKMIRAEIVSAVGADRKMSNVRGKAKLDAGFDIKGTTNPTALIKARGHYFGWVEFGTQDHAIRARGSKFTRRGNRRPGARALTTPGGMYSRVWVRGMEPKRPFEKGWKRAAPETPLIFQREVRAAFARGWGV